MHIGEIMLKRGWVEWEPLALAIDDHKGTGVRLASFLVARGDVDFDDASRALAEQAGVAAALRRHLERRDREAARVLPVSLARRLTALPLGRLANGTLIVCVRDPSDAVHDELARVAGEVALAVAPAKYLERLVEAAYPPGTSGELEIPVELDDPEEPGDLDFDLLDDHGEPAGDVDFAIDIEVPAEVPKPVSTSRALPVEIKAKPPAPAAARDSLDATLAACRDIDELGWLLDVVTEYVSKRWVSSLLVELRDRRAVGVRGHGAKLKAAKTFVIDLEEPSIVRAARDERRIVLELPDPPSEEDTTIAAALAGSSIVAAPLTKGDAVAYVLLVGDPVDKDPEETEIDLGLLSEGVGDALARL